MQPAFKVLNSNANSSTTFGQTTTMEGNNYNLAQTTIETNDLKSGVQDLKEARRQYLLGAKKNRKYVASTLFYGRYDRPAVQSKKTR